MASGVVMANVILLSRVPRDLVVDNAAGLADWRFIVNYRRRPQHIYITQMLTEQILSMDISMTASVRVSQPHGRKRSAGSRVSCTMAAPSSTPTEMWTEKDVRDV